MSYYIDLTNRRANAISDLTKMGVHWVELMRLEVELAKHGLDTEQSNEVLTVLAIVLRNSLERWWAERTVESCCVER